VGRLVAGSPRSRLLIARFILFRLKLFGGISLQGPHGPLTGRAVQRHRLGLLALLGGMPSSGLTRDKLIAFLWPDSIPDRARPLLSDSIYRINQAVGGEAVVVIGDVLQLNPERVWCDVVEFRSALDRQDWQRAVEIHSAPFLDGFYLADAAEFERWSEVERQQLAQEKLRALERLAQAAEDPASSVRWWQRLAAESPFSSRIALELMRALERTGERAAAIQHAQVHARLMRDELELPVDPEVLAYAERLRTEPAQTAPVSVPRARVATVTSDVPPQPSTANARGPRSWQPFALALAAVAAVVLVVAGVFRKEPAPAGDAVTSIVVLPFSDHSPRRDQEYFADGITEELMVRLAHTPGLRVVGRTSAFAFKGKPVDARELAARLNVNAILSGSVSLAAQQVRITAQLVDANTGFEIWSETYQRETAEVLHIQGDIARAIAERLRLRLGDSTAVATVASATDDPDAYNLYLRGRFEWHKRTEQGLRNAVTYLQQAAARTPDHARVHAALGDAYAVLGFYDYMPPRTAFPAAKAAALRALQLDPTLAEAHSTLGYVALYHEWEWQRGEREFLRSLELNPGYSTAHQWYANYLTAMGRFDEAVREMRSAQDIDPLSLIANAALGWVWYYAGEYERAVEQLDRTIELNRDFELAHLWRGLALQELKRFDEAKRAMARAVQLSGGSAISTAQLAQLHAVSGDAQTARKLLAAVQSNGYAPAYEIAKVYDALGDRPRALTWLRRAHDERSHSIAFLRVDPQLRGLRSDTQFNSLLRQVKLDRK
jgi:TolB-like protein/DNA-binding SARP family transcriptional activator/Flp pilus assembly protein TadD